MYTATMRYKFQKEKFEEACQIWEKYVMQQALAQPGFVRMQFLTNIVDSSALAVGTWKTQQDAQNFMRTGVFKDLLQKLKGISLEQPQPEIWNLKYFEES